MTARTRRRFALVAAGVAVAAPLAACGAGSGTAAPAARTTPSAPAAADATPPASGSGSGSGSADSPTGRRVGTPTGAATGTGSGGQGGAGATAGPPPSSSRPTTPTGHDLAGKVVVLDPGHDGGNAAHPDVINRLVNAVTERKGCDTVGAETASGYAEHSFTFGVSRRVDALLTARGARVVLTRTNDTGVGPCVTQRAAVGGRVHADAAVSVHADGGPTTGTGFHVLEPVPIGPNDAIVAPSRRLGAALHDAYTRVSGEPNSSYAGSDGIAPRTDLAGLNLATVPTVFIECANMANPFDATRLTTPSWRERAAEGIADGIADYLTGERPPS